MTIILYSKYILMHTPFKNTLNTPNVQKNKYNYSIKMIIVDKLVALLVHTVN